MQSIISFHKAQRIFHSIILLIHEYFQIMWVLAFTTFSKKRQFSWVMSSKDNISNLSQWLFRSINDISHAYFWGQGKDASIMTLSWLFPPKGPSHRILRFHAWCPSRVTGRDNGTTDVPISFAGLVTIAQSCLVHRILQGVEHTDPTEWSNSHLSIGDKFVMAVWRTVRFFITCPLFSFQQQFSHSYGNGSATLIYFKSTESVIKWLSTTYMYVYHAISILSTWHGNMTQTKYLSFFTNFLFRFT